MEIHKGNERKGKKGNEKKGANHHTKYVPNTIRSNTNPITQLPNPIQTTKNNAQKCGRIFRRKEKKRRERAQSNPIQKERERVHFKEMYWFG